MKRLYGLILFIGLLFVGVSVSRAETYTDWSFVVAPTSLPIVCNADGSFTFRWRVYYDLPYTGIFQVFTARRNGVVVYTNPVAQPFSGVGVVGGIWNGGVSATPVTINLTWVYSYQGVDFYYSNITFTCFNGVFSNITYSNVNLFASGGAGDDRINYQHGDLFAAAYVREDSAGMPALHIYCIDGSSRGYLGLVVENGAMAGASPTENIMIAQTNQCAVPVAVYRLSSGEYQMNIGPDDEGKTYVTIWSGMPITNLYYQELNLYGD
jgi:hypothetical protein